MVNPDVRKVMDEDNESSLAKDTWRYFGPRFAGVVGAFAVAGVAGVYMDRDGNGEDVTPPAPSNTINEQVVLQSEQHEIICRDGARLVVKIGDAAPAERDLSTCEPV